MTILKKVILCAGPVPPEPLTDTRIGIDLPADDLEWGIYSNTATGEPAQVDWGDGTVETLVSGAQNVHAYSRGGAYEVRISDAIGKIRCCSTLDGSPFKTRYPLRIRSFRTGAAKLTSVYTACFSGAANMTCLDCADGNVDRLGQYAFDGCRGLSGKLYFPKVATVYANSFRNCTGGIAEFHFAAEHEEQIRRSGQFESDPTLGTGTARCVFDL